MCTPFLVSASDLALIRCARFRRQRAMQADEIAGFQKFFERQQANILLGGQHCGDVGIERDNLHLMRLRQARDFRADRAEPNQAQRFVTQFTARKFLFLPLARLHRGVGLRHGMRHGEQQRHRVLGNADGVSAGGVHDQHALARGGVEVDVVDAHAGASDDPRRLAASSSSAVTFVALRTSSASASRISSATLPFVLGRFTTSQEGSAFRIPTTLVGNAVCDKNFHCFFSISSPHRRRTFTVKLQENLSVERRGATETTEPRQNRRYDDCRRYTFCAARTPLPSSTLWPTFCNAISSAPSTASRSRKS